MKILSSINPTKLQFDDSINKILSKPGYKNLKNPLYDFINKVKHYIEDWLLKMFMKLFSNLSGASSISNKLSVVFIIIGILFVTTLIMIVCIKINKKITKSKKIKEILGEKIDEKTTPYSLKSKAASYEKVGDLRQAIRYDFIAVLLLMHENNLLYLDETKTNEENYIFLRKNNFMLLSTFRYLIDTFNFSWYGHKVCTNEIYQIWKNNMASLWNGVISSEIK